MNTSSFLAALRAHAGLPLVFRSGAHAVEPSYHLTEVKRVAYETMDCGAMRHRWTETQFEIWVPATPEPGRGHMPAQKFLAIIDRVEKELPLDRAAPARIHLSLGGNTVALHEVLAVTAHDGELRVELAPDRAQCKARERALAAGDSLGCGCGTATDGPSAGEPVAAGCGCDTNNQPVTSGRRSCCV